MSVFLYQALQLSHMKHLNDDSLAALVTSAQNIRVLGLQEPGRCVAAASSWLSITNAIYLTASFLLACTTAKSASAMPLFALPWMGAHTRDGLCA